MLPVRKIVLFKHGIAYFEREGSVEGDASIELQFKASEMNDVLKSLTTLDVDGGAISSISYESTKPASRMLEEVAIQLPDSNVLTSLISQIQGASISFTIAGKSLHAKIVGVESFQKTDGDKPMLEHRLVVLTDGKRLQSFNLLEVEAMEIEDDKIREDLAYLLNALLSSKRADSKTMQIFAKGKGARKILISYIIEAPVWKTSYRVLLQPGEKPLLQGWALIDNTHDEDWNDISLSLVAGLPVSFVHDLYSMRFQQRPVVRVSNEPVYAPPVLEETVATDVQESGVAAIAAAPAMQVRAIRSMQQKVEVTRQSREAGEMYEYAIQNPVTVKRGQSALVPILAEHIDGTRIAVFNESIREKNPMAALEIKNNTGTTLEGGPLTVFEATGYAGEAMLKTMIPASTQIVPFAVELGCIITRDHRSKTQPVHQVKIANGVVYLYHAVLHSTTYLIQNNSARTLDLVLEHPFRHGWELTDSPEPFERTDNYYRIRKNSDPNSRMDITVTEKGLEHRSIAVASITAEQIRELVSTNYLDAKAQHSLKEILELQNRIVDLDRNMKVLGQNVQSIFKNQERLRQNLQSLGQRQEENELRQKYVKQLSEEEDRVHDITGKIDSLSQERLSLEQIRADKIQKLSYSNI